MIIVRLTGGIGNQMFQYATGRRLAYKNKCNLKLDIDWFKNTPLSVTPRRYELQHFNIKEIIASAQEISQLRRDARHILITKARRFLDKVNPFYRRIYVLEKHYHFNPRILKLSGDVYLDGFWQSEMYFKDIEEIIRSEFLLKDSPKGQNKELIEAAQQNHSVSLHIRRGDYVNNPVGSDIHSVCDIPYYNKCIEYIAAKVKDPYFFIFSDEPEWAKTLRIPYKTYLIEYNGPDNGHEDLRIMSHCKHHIIANSSFSWWGAWLNSNPNKIVIAPEKWFNVKDKSTKDLIPAEWIRA